MGATSCATLVLAVVFLARDSASTTRNKPTRFSAVRLATMPREIVTVQMGQCGNQSARILSLVSIDALNTPCLSL